LRSWSRYPILELMGQKIIVNKHNGKEKAIREFGILNVNPETGEFEFSHVALQKIQGGVPPFNERIY
jgi:hypothetical protein